MQLLQNMVVDYVSDAVAAEYGGWLGDHILIYQEKSAERDELLCSSLFYRELSLQNLTTSFSDTVQSTLSEL